MKDGFHPFRNSQRRRRQGRHTRPFAVVTDPQRMLPSQRIVSREISPGRDRMRKEARFPPSISVFPNQFVDEALFSLLTLYLQSWINFHSANGDICYLYFEQINGSCLSMIQIADRIGLAPNAENRPAAS